MPGAKGAGMSTTRMSGIRLARRLDEVGFSDIVQVRNKVMAMRAEGIQVYSLHGGEPFFETPDDIKFAAVKALVQNQTHYAPSSGILPLRQALVEKLARKNGIRATSDEVLATVGGSQGLYAAFQSVLDPGDDALVFSPYWTPIGDLVTGAQARPLLVPSDHRTAQWDSQNTGAVLHAAGARRFTTTLRRTPAAWCLRGKRRKKWRRSPANAI